MHHKYKKSLWERDFQSKSLEKSGLCLPKMKKITLQISLKEQNFESKKQLFAAAMALQIIGAQKGKPLRSTKAVAVWRLIKGDQTAMSLILRGPRMEAFMENLTELILPSLKPFEGIKESSLDNKGNLSFSLANIFVQPQLEREQIHFQQGFNIRGSFGEDFKQLPIEVNIVTTAKTKEEGRAFLTGLRLPLVKK